MRDGLIQCLALIQQSLAKEDGQTSGLRARSNSALAEVVSASKAVADPTARIAQITTAASSAGTGADEDDAKVEREAKLALGLLLKHRGGPGFGHGRLQGKELDMMKAKLREVAQLLASESS